MIYAFSILGIFGLLGSGMYLAMMLYDYEVFRSYYTGSLDTIVLMLLGSLVFLAIARILSQLKDLHEKMKEQEAATKISLNKDLGNWPPSA